MCNSNENTSRYHMSLWVYKISTFASVIALTAILFARPAISQQPPTFDISTKKLTILRADGSSSMVMEEVKGTSCVRFMDTKGTERLASGIANNRPFLSLSDEKGVSRLRLFTDERDRPQLLMLDERGVHRLWLGLEPFPSLQFLNDEGKQQLYITANLETIIQLHDNKGEARVVIGTRADKARLQLLSPDQRQRINLTSGPDSGVAGFYSGPSTVHMVMGSFPDNKAGVMMVNDNEESRAELMYIKGKRPYLKMFDEMGKTLFEK